MRLRNKKTREVVDFKIIADYDDCTSGWRLEKQDGLVLFYDHIDGIKEEWEDYTPKEPLIEDEKIRKAVRAWAEANDYGSEEIYEFEDFSTGWKSWGLDHKENGDDNEIHFNGGVDFDRINHQGHYTIEELCGEEEE